ncbi:permuted papain-like amidase YaeF/Yiix C92 family enzyme [Limnobacter thiooxidans]|uniref:Distant relative of cell wall-associated hydrolase n=1 Tax=Limnobacter thiooxidans TaxID=131080 RepID=A0AA86MBU4_9BURK|nr:permuted papain-like amidase YaeF/Yiix C92 family enzyme [Limnobacter thiooxidans]BET27058.1 hypothetical protein RGQ30_25590 [Limnobacter thiooxidans]
MLSSIQAADIIVTNSGNLQSRGIQGVTCASYSHAILVLNNSFCIEATPQFGVARVALSEVLNGATKVDLFRYRGITHFYADKVCNSIIRYEGKPYDFRGAVRSAISSGCSNVKRLLPATVLIEVADEVLKDQSAHDSQFYCSELIVRAFEMAGLFVTKYPAHAVSPGGLVKSESLKFVKALKS